MPPAHGTSGNAKCLPEVFAAATCVIRQLKTHSIYIIDHAFHIANTQIHILDAYPTQPPKDIAICSDILIIEHAVRIPMLIPHAHGYLHQA